MWGRYNAKQKTFKPLTGYLDDPYFEEFGGACGITKLADELAGQRTPARRASSSAIPPPPHRAPAKRPKRDFRPGRL